MVVEFTEQFFRITEKARFGIDFEVNAVITGGHMGSGISAVAELNRCQQHGLAVEFSLTGIADRIGDITVDNGKIRGTDNRIGGMPF
ncbi:hypothetical protein [Victivallis vadensis]|uniref:hypothetical protein n=1 Tax=Victivallis vadensis TaxID=172901 RepID=UPI003AF73BA9